MDPLLAVTLDAPAEEVEPLVEVNDVGLGFREAQADRGQDLGELVA